MRFAAGEPCDRVRATHSGLLTILHPPFDVEGTIDGARLHRTMRATLARPDVDGRSTHTLHLEFRGLTVAERKRVTEMVLPEAKLLAPAPRP